jgi:GNAT superfamily N-acetyltransferase
VTFDIAASQTRTSVRPAVASEERALPRPPVTTRPAVAADVPILVSLWGELRQVGGRAERAVNPFAVPDVERRFLDVISSRTCRVVLACVGGEPAGMAVMRAVQSDPLSDCRVVQISHVVVADSKRRRGVGHALVAAAADFADECQVEYLAAGVYPSLRDASRFYARLGFAAAAVQRVAPVAIVRRRLGLETGSLRAEELARRRNRLRRPVPAQRVRNRVAEPAD